MDFQCIKEIILLIFEEFFLLLDELGHDISEKAKNVWLILDVIIWLTADSNNLTKNWLLR